MVDCYLLNLTQIDKEQRRAIIEYVVKEKKIGPKAFGVTQGYLYEVRRGKAKASDRLLCRALSFLTEDELRVILKGNVPWITMPTECIEDCVKKCLARCFPKTQNREVE